MTSPVAAIDVVVDQSVTYPVQVLHGGLVMVCDLSNRPSVPVLPGLK